MNRFAHFFGILAAVASFSASAASSLQDINYSVTKDESKRDIKRVVEIVLAERVDQPTLEALANQIKDSNPTSFQRTFIGWRIKGEEDGAYWAKTDFVPALNVQFLGATVADYNKLKTTSAAADGEVFGSWLSTWGADYKMVGYRKGGKIFIRSTFTDGSSSTKEFVPKNFSGRSVLVDAEGSDFGEYYLVNAHGDLEFWGEDGSFYTAKKTD
ncbi:hypothetical protein [Pseudomonas haemolytica]|uniref:Uncharacterized protein n=1 Tax=Pseudomonas haemolytica TaxID=2600065 RepID=A0ABS1H1R1_9PSED|nr:hypothetical protein [Pseudomonas haemolytica]MBK3463050.1 hypothetical protein [Pseudomonas haemolytica]